MFNIGELLKKFQSIGEKNDNLLKIFRSTASGVGINLDNYPITYKNKVFTVNCPHTIKNLLYVKKLRIIELLRDQGVAVEDVGMI